MDAQRCYALDAIADLRALSTVLNAATVAFDFQPHQTRRRKKKIEHILFDVIDDDGGPLIYDVSSEQQQRSFDSSCRKLHRFLGQHPC
jgi:hypothetical protein